MSSREEAARRRAERSGSGPVREGTPPPRFPGASQGFALFGEVMLMGILVTLVSLPIVTLPVALAAGIRHMRRFLEAEQSGLALFWRDVRDGLLGSAVVGIVTAILVIILLIDIDLAGTGFLPGGPFIAAVGWVGLLLTGVSLFLAAREWSPERGWRVAVRAVPAALRGDLVGAAYLAATVVFAAIVTWQLIPLIVPALGCVIFAIVAVPERPRRASAPR